MTAPIRLSAMHPLVREVCEKAMEHAQTMSGSWESAAEPDGDARPLRFVKYPPCCDICVAARRLAAAVEEER